MSKVKVHTLPQKEQERIIGDFFMLVLRLTSKQEVIDFFLSLMTPSEALMFARRIQIARELLQEKNTYENIRVKLKVSFQTVTKIDRWLHAGDEKRCQWLAKEITRLDGSFYDKKRRPVIGASPLNRYPEHRMMKELLVRLLG